MSDFASVAWPRRRLAEALVAVATERGLLRHPGQPSPAPPPVGQAALSHWFDAVAEPLGLDVDAAETTHEGVEPLVRRAAPALFEIGDGESAGTVAVLSVRGANARVALPGGGTASVPVAALRDTLCAGVERAVAADADVICDASALAGRARERARRAICGKLAAGKPVTGVWIVRLGAGAPIRDVLREAGLFRLAGTLLAAHALQYVLWIVSWKILGTTVLDGRFETSWLVAWALVLATVLPLRLVDLRAAGLLATRLGGVLRRRLLAGAMRLDPEEIRSRGIGQLLGEALETDQIEQAGAGGAYLSATAIVEVVGAAVVLSLGGHAVGGWGWAPVLLLVVWTAFSLALAARLVAARRRWTDQRLGMTNDMVERMGGHRTLVAQESPSRWNQGDDGALETYVRASSDLDRATVRVEALIPRGWLALAALGIVPVFATAAGNAAAMGAVVGGVLLAYMAFRSFAAGTGKLAGAIVAWEQVRPLWDAAARPVERGDPRFASRDRESARSGAAETDRPIAEAHGVLVQPAGRAQPVLQGASCEVRAGDRILLQGGSGGGKSTLASVLAGLRRPNAGLVLQRGLDRPTLGEVGWRRRIVLAPQFHENHVLQAPLLFNALMGREWPPGEDDVRACEEVLRGLGLEPLVQRMPGGLGQLVGESGWQMSHGEQSRLFIARALLQDAGFVLLDESLAALDPATFRETLAFVESRARTLLVIAHE